jgi:3-phenylpropionate/trans-cinnamate dioxygenase ferredoxin reductase subunit
VIIGAGEAGVAAAGALRENGCESPIVLLSAEKHLPYERPPLSKELLLGVTQAPRLIREEQWYAARRIELRLGCRARAVDSQRRLIMFNSLPDLPYEQLLLATGAAVRRLTFAGAGEVRYLRDLDEAHALAAELAPGKRIVVIGGGVIGLEVASAAIVRGCQVTVLEAADRLMSRVLTPEISAIVLRRHVEAGVVVHLNAKVGQVVREAGGTYVELSDEMRLGFEDRRLKADVVVGAAGVIPEDTLARSAEGCFCEDGIVVDGCGRTRVAGIFAAGDVARFPHPLFGSVMRLESWQHAGRHGAHVGRAMLGDAAAYSGATNTVSTCRSRAL